MTLGIRPTPSVTMVDVSLGIRKNVVALDYGGEPPPVFGDATTGFVYRAIPVRTYRAYPASVYRSYPRG